MTQQQENFAIQCRYFQWTLYTRKNMLYADGRSNAIDAGRHSLGTRDADEARRRLAALDEQRAIDLGRAPRRVANAHEVTPLSLAKGRELYEEFLSRPAVTGGVKPSTRKRYRAVLDKFMGFAEGRQIAGWHVIDASLLQAYAAFLEPRYRHKTLVNELTTLKQMVRWLIEAGHLPGRQPIVLRVRKAESQPAYCWRPEHVAAMLEFTRSSPTSNWLHPVILTLACTGMRISELVGLKWSDLDFDRGQITLTDETGAAATGPRRQLKSGRSRSLPIHDQLQPVLKNLPRNGRFVLMGPRGGRLKADTVRRSLVRLVVKPLAQKFPSPPGERGFADGRLHSFRHYFCSTCANDGVAERIVMDWLGHADSEMIRNYYHLHDDVSRRAMQKLNLVGGVHG